MTFDKSANYYMAIDFGTNHVSVTIGAPTGVPLATVKQPVAFFKPEQGTGSSLEFDPAAALKLVIATANLAIGESNILPSEISGIGVTSQRRGLVLLNLEGSAIHAVSNRDMRATKEGAEIDANALVDLWELTGHGPGRLTAWAHLKWILNNDSETYDRTRTMCSIADWLALELTGELLMEETLAVESGLGLVATGDPSRALSPAFNLGDTQLPATCPPGNSSRAAKEIVHENARPSRQHTGRRVRSRYAKWFARTGCTTSKRRWNSFRLEHALPTNYRTPCI